MVAESSIVERLPNVYVGLLRGSSCRCVADAEDAVRAGAVSSETLKKAAARAGSPCSEGSSLATKVRGVALAETGSAEHLWRDDDLEVTSV